MKMNWDTSISKGRPQKFSFCLLVGCSKFLDCFHENSCDTCINILKIIFNLNYQFECRYELLLKRKIEKTKCCYAVPVCEKRVWWVLSQVVCVYLPILNVNIVDINEELLCVET